MRFKKYITEGIMNPGYKKSRTKQISYEEAVNSIIKNCKNNFKSIYVTGNKMPIYRGNYGPEFGFIDTNTGEPRQSANTENFYTLLFDNLPSWKGWPKRSRGLVCSTSDSVASDYGDLSQVIPYDNSLIGVCSRSDIWMSFNKVMRNKYDDLPAFNDWLLKTFQLSKVKIPNTWNELVSSIMEVDKIYKSGNITKEDEDNYGRYYSIDDFEVFTEKGNPMDILNKMFDPKKNDFKMGIKNLKSDKEVWIQGKCILVRINSVDKIIEGVLDEI